MTCSDLTVKATDFGFVVGSSGTDAVISSYFDTVQCLYNLQTQLTGTAIGKFGTSRNKRHFIFKVIID